MMVRVVQFLRPNGRQQECFTDISERCETSYVDMTRAGGRLTAEELTTGEISLCVEHPEHGDFDSRVVVNGPPVTRAIEEMFDAFDVDRFRDFARGITEEETTGAKVIVKEHEQEKNDG